MSEKLCYNHIGDKLSLVTNNHQKIRRLHLSPTVVTIVVTIEVHSFQVAIIFSCTLIRNPRSYFPNMFNSIVRMSIPSLCSRTFQLPLKRMLRKSFCFRGSIKKDYVDKNLKYCYQMIDFKIKIMVRH